MVCIHKTHVLRFVQYGSNQTRPLGKAGLEHPMGRSKNSKRFGRPEALVYTLNSEVSGMYTRNPNFSSFSTRKVIKHCLIGPEVLVSNNKNTLEVV
jgi:hypothetical protein